MYCSSDSNFEFFWLESGQTVVPWWGSGWCVSATQTSITQTSCLGGLKPDDGGGGGWLHLQNQQCDFGLCRFRTLTCVTTQRDLNLSNFALS